MTARSKALGHPAALKSHPSKNEGWGTRQSRRTYVSWYGISFVYAGLGDKDQAFACLEKAYQLQDSRLADLKVEPVLRSLHSDSRFAELVRKVGLP